MYAKHRTQTYGRPLLFDTVISTAVNIAFLVIFIFNKISEGLQFSLSGFVLFFIFLL